MVPSDGVKVLVPNVKRSVPGGGGLLWRISSNATIASVGLLSRGFLKLQRNVKVEGMDKFLAILESSRDRGVITGTIDPFLNLQCSVEPSFNVGFFSTGLLMSSLDDPLLWGILPYRCLLDPKRTRWALGAADICFTNR
jgi:monolysocardiolipin acyltransferase